jgi:hypothetical protein
LAKSGSRTLLIDRDLLAGARNFSDIEILAHGDKLILDRIRKPYQNRILLLC